MLYQCTGETRKIWTNSEDSRDTVSADDGRVHTSDQATIWRWREAYQHEFAARMDWCVQRRDQANHHPFAVVNGSAGRSVLRIAANSGDTVTAAPVIRIEIGRMKPKSEPAVEEARHAGFDIELIESNLALSPGERWRQHQLALDTALELQQACIARDARLQPPAAPAR